MVFGWFKRDLRTEDEAKDSFEEARVMISSDYVNIRNKDAMEKGIEFLGYLEKLDCERMVMLIEGAKNSRNDYFLNILNKVYKDRCGETGPVDQR